MSALDRLLVSAAVAVSPAAHRATRREQWAADVQGAAELDLSPTALAFGALTTALLHRRVGHRSTWGNTMTTAPSSVRRTPHTIPTIPVLLGVAVTAFLLGCGLLGLLQRYNGLRGAMPVFLLDAVAVTVLPALVVGVSALLVTGAPLRRRAIGALVVLAVGTVWFAVTTGWFNPPVHAAVWPGTVASAWLAVWLVVLRRPGWTWSLLLLPIVASVLVFPLGSSLGGAGLSYSVAAALGTAVQVVPFLVAIIGAVLASRFSTVVPDRFVEHEEPLVDRSA